MDGGDIHSVQGNRRRRKTDVYRNDHFSLGCDSSQSLEIPRGDIQMFVSRCWASHNARKGQNYRLLVLPGL